MPSKHFKYCFTTFKFFEYLLINIKKMFSSLMNIHNNKVGQKILSKHIEEKCKCHGISGSCVTKTCWKVVSGN